MKRVGYIIALMLGAAATAGAGETFQYVLVSGKTGNADLLLVEAGNPLAVPKNLTEHPARDCYPAWSPDGTRIAFVSDRDKAGNVYVIDADGKNLAQVTHEKAASARCYCPSFSPDGKKICYGRLENEKSTVHVINIDGTGDKTILDNGWDPAWSPDGSRIAFASKSAKGQRLCVCDPDGGNMKELRDVDNPAGYTLPAWSPDGTRIAYCEVAAAQSLELFLINPDGTGRRQLTWVQFVNFYPAWSPDGKSILFVHADQTGCGYVRINADGTQMEISPITMMDRPERFDFRPAFRPIPGSAKPANPIKLASHTREKTPLNVALTARARPHPAAVYLAAYSPDGKRLVSVAEDGGMMLCDVKDGLVQPYASMRAHTAAILTASWSPDGKTVMTSGRENEIKLWDVEKKECRAVIHEADRKVVMGLYSPNGKAMAVACEGRVVQFRDAETLKVKSQLTVPGDDGTIIISMAFSPGSQTLVVAGAHRDRPDQGGFVTAWDVKAGKNVWSAAGKLAGVPGVDYSSDGSVVAAACLDSTVRMFDAKTGKERPVLRGHAAPTSYVAFSPDGTRLASIGLDHTVRLWDVPTGRSLAVLAGHVAQAARVSFAPDGKYFTSTANDGTVCVWRIED